MWTGKRVATIVALVDRQRLRVTPMLGGRVGSFKLELIVVIWILLLESAKSALFCSPAARVTHEASYHPTAGRNGARATSAMAPSPAKIAFRNDRVVRVGTSVGPVDN